MHNSITVLGTCRQGWGGWGDFFTKDQGRYCNVLWDPVIVAGLSRRHLAGVKGHHSPRDTCSIPRLICCPGQIGHGQVAITAQVLPVPGVISVIEGMVTPVNGAYPDPLFAFPGKRKALHRYRQKRIIPAFPCAWTELSHVWEKHPYPNLLANYQEKE